MKVVYLSIIAILLMLYACNNGKQSSVDSEDISKIEKDTVVQNDTGKVVNYLDGGNIQLNDSTPVDEYYNDPLVISYKKVSDTMYINEDCVIFLWSDSLEIANMQQEHPEDYIEILDDMIYYASDAAMALDDAKIKNFFFDKSVLQFENSPNDIFIQRKKTEGNMILLKIGKKPYISYAIDFNLDLCLNYFKEPENDTIF